MKSSMPGFPISIQWIPRSCFVLHKFVGTIQGLGNGNRLVKASEGRKETIYTPPSLQRNSQQSQNSLFKPDKINSFSNANKFLKPMYYYY